MNDFDFWGTKDVNYNFINELSRNFDKNRKIFKEGMNIFKQNFEDRDQGKRFVIQKFRKILESFKFG